MRNAQGIHVSVLLMAGLGLFACDDEPAAPDTETLAAANGPREGKASRFARGQGRRVSFADLAIFFEYNSTDDDLGAQVFVDAEAWNELSIESPDGDILEISATNELATLGLTELRFESAEPAPSVVLRLFDAGKYEFEGQTVNGDHLQGTATLARALPPAPVFSPEDGDEVDPANTVITWVAIAGLAGYEVIVANEQTGLSMTVELGPAATRLRVPAEFMAPRSLYKVEILAIATNGNKTITEHTFTTTR